MLDDFESLVETIRIQLSKGVHQLDLGERPYSGTSRLLASVLYGHGYRKANEPKVALQAALSAEHNVWATLSGAMSDLQEEHDSIKAAIEHEDAYQSGVLHGLDKSIVGLRERLEICKANIAAYQIQLTNVLERDKLNP